MSRQPSEVIIELGLPLIDASLNEHMFDSSSITVDISAPFFGESKRQSSTDPISIRTDVADIPSVSVSAPTYEGGNIAELILICAQYNSFPDILRLTTICKTANYFLLHPQSKNAFISLDYLTNESFKNLIISKAIEFQRSLANQPFPDSIRAEATAIVMH